MKTLNTLIKLKKNLLNQYSEQRREAERVENILIDTKDMFNEARERELKLYHGSSYGVFLEDFIKDIDAQISDIEKKIEETRKVINSFENLIRETFGELKKFEIIKDKKIKTLKEKQLLQDNKLLDEVALKMYLKDI